MLAELAGLDGVIVVVVIAVVLFGGSQIPKLARSLGSAHTEFKKGLAEGAAKGTEDDAKDPVKDPAKTEGTDTPSS
ncbi:MAG: twin-arginine translocase TatA/TatE family subunit [Acidimicrobiales bacterium]